MNKFDMQILNEDFYNGNKYPFMIVLTYCYSHLGKTVRKVTKDKYTHASVSTDIKLNTMYSFLKTGFGVESLEDYMRFNREESIIKINTVFLNKEQYDLINEYFEKMNKNIKNTRYNFIHLLYALLNKTDKKSGPNSLSQICSEFVTNVFKLINVDLLNKPSNLVRPQDLSEIKNKNVYTLYEGKAKDYNYKKVSRILKKLNMNSKFLTERKNIDEEYLEELNILDEALENNFYYLMNEAEIFANRNYMPNIPRSTHIYDLDDSYGNFSDVRMTLNREIQEIKKTYENHNYDNIDDIKWNWNNDIYIKELNYNLKEDWWD